MLIIFEMILSLLSKRPNQCAFNDSDAVMWKFGLVPPEIPYGCFAQTISQGIYIAYSLRNNVCAERVLFFGKFEALIVAYRL